MTMIFFNFLSTFTTKDMGVILQLLYYGDVKILSVPSDPYTTPVCSPIKGITDSDW